MDSLCCNSNNHHRSLWPALCKVHQHDNFYQGDVHNGYGTCIAQIKHIARKKKCWSFSLNRIDIDKVKLEVVLKPQSSWYL